MAAIDSFGPLMFSLLPFIITLSPTPLTVLADSSGEIIVHELPREWHMWKAEHGKLYQSLEEEMWRHTVWLNNMKIIQRHNAESVTHGYTLKMNHLGDLVSQYVHDIVLSNQSGKLNLFTTYIPHFTPSHLISYG